MKNNWIKVIGVLVLSGALVSGLEAQARQGRGLGPCGAGYGPAGAGYGQGYAQNTGQVYGRGYAQPGRAFAALNLTEEQQTQIEDMRLVHYQEMKPLRTKQQELASAKFALMSEIDMDVKGLNSIIDQQTDLQNTIQKKRLEHQVAMQSVLTDKQKIQLDMMKSNARPGRGQQMARAGRGGRGAGYGDGFRGARAGAGYGTKAGAGYRGAGYGRASW